MNGTKILANKTRQIATARRFSVCGQFDFTNKFQKKNLLFFTCFWHDKFIEFRQFFLICVTFRVKLSRKRHFNNTAEPVSAKTTTNGVKLAWSGAAVRGQREKRMRIQNGDRTLTFFLVNRRRRSPAVD